MRQSVSRFLRTGQKKLIHPDLQLLWLDGVVRESTELSAWRMSSFPRQPRPPDEVHGTDDRASGRRCRIIPTRINNSHQMIWLIIDRLNNTVDSFADEKKDTLSTESPSRYLSLDLDAKFLFDIADDTFFATGIDHSLFDLRTRTRNRVEEDWKRSNERCDRDSPRHNVQIEATFSWLNSCL